LSDASDGLQVPVDIHYVVAFAKFDVGDHANAGTHLDLIPGISNASKGTMVGEPPLSRLQLSQALTLQSMLGSDPGVDTIETPE
jgi:hypothetical protein